MSVSSDTLTVSLMESFGLTSKCRGVNGLFPVWHCHELGTAIRGSCFARIGGLGNGLTRIREKSTAMSSCVAETVSSSSLDSEPVVTRRRVGSEDHIITLPNSDEQPVLAWKGGHRYEICSNDGEEMAIQFDTEKVVHRRVDKPETVFLAWGDGDFRIATSASSRVFTESIDEDIVSSWWSCSGLRIDERLCIHLFRCTIEPFRQWHHSQINIVVAGCGAVDDNGANNA